MMKMIFVDGHGHGQDYSNFEPVLLFRLDANEGRNWKKINYLTLLNHVMYLQIELEPHQTPR